MVASMIYKQINLLNNDGLGHFKTNTLNINIHNLPNSHCAHDLYFCEKDVHNPKKYMMFLNLINSQNQFLTSHSQ